LAGLSIYLLGGLDLSWDQSPLPSIPTTAARSLLAYLIFHHNQPHTRDLLAGTFWPDQPDAVARRRLSQALWRIRRALGPASDRLTAGRAHITFQLLPEDWLDVYEFERRARHAERREVDASLAEQLEACIQLYRGDLLAGYYDNWPLLERERLRGIYLVVLERLLALYKQGGDDERALSCAQRLVGADPLRESAHRELMRLYHLLGRSRAALEHFATLHDLLMEEMGAPPSSTTSALFQEIAAALEEAAQPHLPVALPPPPVLQDLSHLPFVGRAKERAALQEAIRAAGQGRGGLALVEGDAGVGKTRLVGEVIADAEWRNLQVGLAKAVPLSVRAPYQLLREGLLPLLTPLRIAQLAELVEPLWLSAVALLLPALAEHLPQLPALPPLDPDKEQERLWEGLVRCVIGLATVSPLLLVLEDLHQADEATLAVLAYLAPRLSESRVLLVLTYRTAEARERAVVRETLDALDRALPLQRLRLLPFDRAEGVDLVRRALGAMQADVPSTRFAERLQDESGSNALFLVETLKSLLEQGALAPSSEGNWVFPPGDQPLPVPASVQELVGERMGRLIPALRTVLELIAILGEEGSFSLLSQVSDKEVDTLLPALEELVRRGFLVEAEARYRFEHDRIQEIVYQVIPPVRRQGVHRQTATVMEGLYPERIEPLAYHFSLARVWDKAAHYHQQAGDQARQVYANAEAIDHYTQALEALERLPDPNELLVYELRLAREAIYALQGARAMQSEEFAALTVLGEQLDDGGPQAALRRATVALRQADYAQATGDYPGTIAAAQKTVDLVQAGLADRREAVYFEAESYLRWATALWRQGDCPAAQRRLEQGLAQARAAELRLQEARMLRGFGVVDYLQGRYAEAQARFEQSLHFYREIGDLGGESTTLNDVGNALYRLGEFAGARTFFEESLRIKQKMGDRQGEGLALNNIGLLCTDLHDYVEAVRYYEQAAHILYEIGDWQGYGLLRNNLGLVHLDQGDYPQASTCFEQALRICRDIGNRRVEILALTNLALVYLGQGVYDQAQVHLEQAGHICREIGRQGGEGWVLAYLGILALRQGDHQAAYAYGQQALQIAQRVEKVLQCLALGVLGYTLTAAGSLDEAAAMYRQGLAVALQLDRAPEAMEYRAGLAHIALKQQHLDQALVYVEEILRYVEIDSLDGAMEPFQVYLICYNVLRANQDPRARQVLEIAHNILQGKAAKIEDESLRRSFLEQVVAHRDVLVAYDELLAQTIERRVQVRLPRIDAPTGRPLRDDEYVEVAWTVETPEDAAVSSKVARRRQRILRLLEEARAEGALPSDRDLAEALGVSPRTLRRDMVSLAAAGHVLATRGRKMSAGSSGAEPD